MLHLGSCLGTGGLADLAPASIDHVITDPPYSEHVHSKQRRVRNGGVVEQDIQFARLKASEIRACSEHFARLAKRWVLVFCDLESVHLWRAGLEEHGLRYVRTMIWHRSNAQPQLSGDRPANGCEAIVAAHAGAGRMAWNGGGCDGFFDYPTVTVNRLHPTEKPLRLMEEIIRMFTDPGDTILDPFAGCATTLVAAKSYGRIPLGWELNPEWHAIGVKRLEGTQQMDLLARNEARQLELGGGS